MHGEDSAADYGIIFLYKALGTMASHISLTRDEREVEGCGQERSKFLRDGESLPFKIRFILNQKMICMYL